MGSGFLWMKIAIRLQETIQTKYDLLDIVDLIDLVVANNLMLMDKGLIHSSNMKERWVHQRVHREG